MSQTLNFCYDLSPSSTQENAIASHLGAVRYAYNWSVARVIDNWEAVKQNPETEYVGISAYELRKALNAEKDNIAP